MKILTSLDCVIDNSRYTATPRGYANPQIFSKSVSRLITNVHYISNFPETVQSAVGFLFSSDPSVSIFVLKTIRDLPCNVPIRWGVLYNLKFRRMFESLTSERWTDISLVLKEFGYGKIKSGAFYLLDPTLNSSTTFETLEIPTASNQNQNQSIIDPFSTPKRLSNSSHFVDSLRSFNSRLSTSNSFNSNSSSNLLTPTSTPTVTVTSRPPRPASVRKKVYSIYSSEVEGSLSAALADKFQPSRFSNELLRAIWELYDQNDVVINNLFKKLELLPTTVPLRWGCIYNIHLRSRIRKNSLNYLSNNLPITRTTLAQWNALKVLLKADGRLQDKSVKNCSILINK